MPSITQVLGAVVVGLASVSALPAMPRLSPAAHRFYARQNPATGLPDGLGDVDILEFALTLENLEATFYQQGFAKFPPDQFAALGLSPSDISSLQTVGQTESIHVTALMAAIAGAGVAPVQTCTYNFGFTDAKGMIATAAVLEAVGVSAYLGAAPLLKNPAILSTAASIATVESRHSSFIRTATNVVAIPSAFDTPLGIRSVFTLAAPFIASCPQGSNLAITPFPAATIAPPANPAAIPGSTIQVSSPQSAAANSCAFNVGGAPGGTVFTPYANGACTVPPAVGGITYVHLTNAAPATGVLTDAIIMAGPAVLMVT